jgi:NAD-dependent dihydropyrimidine dehydrogenase PreA subunit
MKNSILKFLELVQEDCLRNGVKIIFHPKTEIKLSKNIGVSGFWTDVDKELHVAIYCDEWLTVLAHEYSHFCQWKEGKFIDDETTNALNDFDDWINGSKELSKKKLEKTCKLIQKCELDCEKRALKFIKKYKLYKNHKLYIQKANSYILGYEAAKIKRKWFKTPPYRTSKIFSNMPKTFTRTLKPSRKMLKLLLETCF